MAKFKHSEVAAKLAIEGTVAAIAGTVKGELGIKPRVLGQQERIDLGMADFGDMLFYPIDDSGVFFFTHEAFTTIWYAGADYPNGMGALEAAIKRLHPGAKMVKDEAHPTERNMKTRTYDIKLPGNHLAIVEAIYPSGKVDNPKFMVRITAMARQN